MVKGSRLGRFFYERDTRVVAFELIGKILFFHEGKKRLSARIVETEAYLGAEDPASHAFRGVTPRNRVMFGPAGFSYVYFTYGFHHCLNVVTERDGKAGAVLIRAAEPLSGIDLMIKRRGMNEVCSLMSGPGKLTQALGITTAHSGLDLTQGILGIEEDEEDEIDLVSGGHFFRVSASERVGIREGQRFLYRFFSENSPFVSRK